MSLQKDRVNSIIKILIFSDFLILSAVGFINPIFALFVANKVHGASLEVVGYSATILLIVKSLAQLPIAKYVDKTPGERDDFNFIFWGSLLASISSFLYLCVSEVWQLYLLQGLYGLANAMAFPSWFALFSRHVDKRKEGFEWGIYSSIVGIGIALTGAAGGIMAQRMGFDAVFITVGVISLMGTLLILLLRKSIIRHDILKIHDK